MNTIKIKHGESIPTNGTLQPFELGYVTSTGNLVIGDANRDTVHLNYLLLDEKGYVPILKGENRFKFQTANATPKIELTSSSAAGRVEFCATSISRAFVLEWPALASGSFYERYNFPEPSTDLTTSKTYEILTSKGGEFGGDFTFKKTVKVNGTLTANGGIVVDTDSYGDYDPNGVPGDSSKPAKDGVVGQLYFVITGD